MQTIANCVADESKVVVCATNYFGDKYANHHHAQATVPSVRFRVVLTQNVGANCFRHVQCCDQLSHFLDFLASLNSMSIFTSPVKSMLLNKYQMMKHKPAIIAMIRTISEIVIWISCVIFQVLNVKNDYRTNVTLCYILGKLIPIFFSISGTSWSRSKSSFQLLASKDSISIFSVTINSLPRPQSSI